jgi:hypothetical protein
MSQPTFLQRTALVTGGCGGLGRAISEAFLRAGANVVIVDINPELIADFKEKVSAAYPECTLVVQADITKDEKIEEVFSAGEEMFGELNFVVNCAGRIDRFDAVAEMVRELMRFSVDLSEAHLLTLMFRHAGEADVGQSHRFESDCAGYSEWQSDQEVVGARQEGQHCQYRLDCWVQRIYLRYVTSLLHFVGVCICLLIPFHRRRCIHSEQARPHRPDEEHRRVLRIQRHSLQCHCCWCYGHEHRPHSCYRGC